jgi:3-phenylpropionate/trans-cinnamate dioxygenase ferredoxin reductase subunit
MVIIGAGEAGARAAEELRKQGYEGSITLIGREPGVSYERPPLSKEQLLEENQPEPRPIVAPERLKELNVGLRSGAEAAGIDRPAHEVVLANGERLAYERLLLATGASPRRLMLPGSDTSGFLYLRTFDDALHIRARLQAKHRIVVIGGGFIGLETAASARRSGCEVTVLEVGPRILMRGVPQQIADAVLQLHVSEGVVFKLGQGISKVEHGQDGYQITLADGTCLACDTVIAGIGAIPDVAVAEGCGLQTENGICTDGQLRTDDPDIYAAGDCCAFNHALYGGKRLRLESWRNAQDQGIHAARNMLGATAAYTAVPWFWSDQYDDTLQVAGLPDYGTLTVQRDGGKNAFYFHLTNDHRLVGASAIGPGIAKDIRLSEMLIEKGAVLSPQQLADPSLKLKQVLNELTQQEAY